MDDVPFQDVWCGPGIGFSSDAVSEDCVVTRKNVSSRGKLDNGERISSHREVYFSFLTNDPSDFSFQFLEKFFFLNVFNLVNLEDLIN